MISGPFFRLRSSEALKKEGHPIGRQKVCELLNRLGYSLQANRKTREGSDHEDRDAQFKYINAQVNAYQQRAQPVISVDAKKKELVGDFKNGGREWQPRGHPVEVRTHDFVRSVKIRSLITLVVSPSARLRSNS